MASSAASRHTVLVGYLARRLGFPVRLIEDRLENMRGGDAHGPERVFDVDVAFDDDGIVRSMKMRALDNVGAYAGRSPFQLGKPIGAIVGPYKINSVQYRAMAVVTNKTTQEAVRAFGQGPTNFAIERMVDEVANALGLDRLEVTAAQFDPPRRIPLSRSPAARLYDSGDYDTVIDKVLAHTSYEDLKARRDRLRGDGQLAGIGIAACLEPNGGNSTFEAAAQPEDQRPRPSWIPAASASISPARSRRPCTRPPRARARDLALDHRRRSARARSGQDPCHAAGFAQRLAEQQPGRQPHGE